MAVNDYDWFVKQIHETYGIDLSSYKESQMKRRLISFRDRNACVDFCSLFDKIMNDETTLKAFLNRMTINVSSFYRNMKRWHVLEQKILPDILHNHRRLNIWSAACSTCEEPYTIAMLISRYLPLSKVSILATDIDENALKKARKGLFHERSFQEVSDDLKEKFFQERDGFDYEIHSHIRQPVRFVKHNLLADPIEGNFDLIICRNVMIYFTNRAKERLYRKFYDALQPGGILFVGSTEQILQAERYGFETEETFFYRKQTKVQEETV